MLFRLYMRWFADDLGFYLDIITPYQYEIMRNNYLVIKSMIDAGAIYNNRVSSCSDSDTC